VTVNARRREESAQSVPTPISVLSSETLETQRIYRVQDMQQLVPSTNVAYVHARQSSISIRGLGNNPASDGLEGSVGVYLDNVYLGRPGMAVFDLLDVEQLEVLRGPQGTLFGKNTTAGVLNITTRKPTFHQEGSISRRWARTATADPGQFLRAAHRHPGRAYQRLPHRGRRLCEEHLQRPRPQRRQAPGLSYPVAVQAQRNLQPALDRRVQRRGLHNGILSLYSTGPTINGVNRYESLAARPAPRWCRARTARSISTPTSMVKVFQGGTSVEANWTLPNDFTLTSISAYRWWDFTPRNDDGLNVPVFYNAGVSVRDKQYSQEIRLASPTGGFFDYVLGAYYFKQDLDNKSFTYNGPQADIWNLTPAGALANVTTIGNGHIDTDSYALFAQGTWHLTERLDFTAGVRGTYEEKSAWVTRDAPFGGAAVTGAAAAARQGRVGAYDSGDLNQYSFAPPGCSA
jgi:iron complex outermembrane receptor protein